MSNDKENSTGTEGGGTPQSKGRRMEQIRYLRGEAEYFRNDIIPWCQEEDKATWERAAQKRIQEAERLERDS